MAVKIRKKCLFCLKNVTLCVGKLALLQAWVCGTACAACKCANVRLPKIELKKMCGGENKKYRRVGNECRLTRCPIEIWSVCWSPVKLVCRGIKVQFIVVCSMVALSSYTCR